MSKAERKGTRPSLEPPREEWRRRIRRVRDESALYAVRGAATTAGGALVTYCVIWLQTRS